VAAAEEAAVEEAAAEAAAMPGEPKTDGTDPPATHSNTRQGVPCFSPAAFKQFTCHFFSMHHLTIVCSFLSDPVSNITYRDT
jgi:hypothetical protein